MTEKMPAYIAFQGGGALGMAHLGAWKAILGVLVPLEQKTGINLITWIIQKSFNAETLVFSLNNCLVT